MRSGASSSRSWEKVARPSRLGRRFGEFQPSRGVPHPTSLCEPTSPINGRKTLRSAGAASDEGGNDTVRRADAHETAEHHARSFGISAAAAAAEITCCIVRSSGHDMKASVDVDRVSSHARGAAADEKRHRASDLRDFDQTMRGAAGDCGVHELVELGDPARRARL